MLCNLCDCFATTGRGESIRYLGGTMHTGRISFSRDGCTSAPLCVSRVIINGSCERVTREDTFLRGEIDPVPVREIDSYVAFLPSTDNTVPSSL